MLNPGPHENEWFVTAFGGLYPLIYSHRDDESAQDEIRNLSALLGISDEPARRVLDVCCGGGRHTAALAGMGFQVTALDLSPVLLKKASAEPGLKGRLVRSDMRALCFRTRFDVVTNLFTSFGYFSNDRENEQALAEMARVLVRGGRLVMDHINRPWLERRLVDSDVEYREGHEIRQRRRIERNRVIKEIEVLKEGQDPIHLFENVRLYRPAEIRSLFEANGLEDLRFYGSFDGRALTGDSPRMLVVASKRGG